MANFDIIEYAYVVIVCFFEQMKFKINQFLESEGRVVFESKQYQLFSLTKFFYYIK